MKGSPYCLRYSTGGRGIVRLAHMRQQPPLSIVEWFQQVISYFTQVIASTETQIHEWANKQL